MRGISELGRMNPHGAQHSQIVADGQIHGTLVRHPLWQSRSSARQALDYSNTQTQQLDRTLPLHVPLDIAEVGGQQLGDLVVGMRLAGLELRSRWPLLDDSVASLHLRSR